MTYRLTATLGGKGTGADRFRSVLRGIAVDGSRNIYAVGDREVKVFDHEGRRIRSWATRHPGISVAVDDDGRVYVGEAGHVEVFGPHGDLLDTWSDRQRLGLVSAVGLVADSVLVADARAPCLRHYTRDGEYVASIGDGGRRNGFSVPGAYLDFTIDRQGQILAANAGKHRVETYSLDGKIIARFGRFGMHAPEDFRGCCNPVNVVATADGRVIVTEKAPPRIKVYEPDGRLVAAFGAKLLDPDCKHMDLAVDADGRLLVSDPVRLRILVFEAVEATAPSGTPVDVKQGE